MGTRLETLKKALDFGMSIRPQVGGFPYLAEALRLAGVTKNIWALPSCQSLFILDGGGIVIQETPLVMGMEAVPVFDKEALILALRADQSGKSTFREFLQATWEAGVVSYEVDFEKRVVTYSGVLGSSYQEAYPAVAVKP